MSTVGQRERLTQQQVLRFFQNALDYDYLGVTDHPKGATRFRFNGAT